MGQVRKEKAEELDPSLEPYLKYSTDVLGRSMTRNEKDSEMKNLKAASELWRSLENEKDKFLHLWMILFVGEIAYGSPTKQATFSVAMTNKGNIKTGTSSTFRKTRIIQEVQKNDMSVRRQFTDTAGVWDELNASRSYPLLLLKQKEKKPESEDPSSSYPIVSVGLPESESEYPIPLPEVTPSILVDLEEDNGYNPELKNRDKYPFKCAEPQIYEQIKRQQINPQLVPENILYLYTVEKEKPYTVKAKERCEDCRLFNEKRFGRVITDHPDIVKKKVPLVTPSVMAYLREQEEQTEIKSLLKMNVCVNAWSKDATEKFAVPLPIVGQGGPVFEAELREAVEHFKSFKEKKRQLLDEIEKKVEKKRLRKQWLLWRVWFKIIYFFDEFTHWIRVMQGK